MNRSMQTPTVKRRKKQSTRPIKMLIAATLTLVLVIVAARVPLGTGSAVAADENDGRVLAMSQLQNLDTMELSAGGIAAARVNEADAAEYEAYLAEQQRQREEAEKERQRQLEEELKKQMKDPSEITPRDTDASFGVALPETAPVDDAYFDNAIFIGNSLMVGFSYYFQNCNDAHYFATVGLNVSSYFSDVLPSGMTIPQAVSSAQFDKVYLMFGVNELGWSSAQVFTDYYAKVIENVRSANPDAEIYVHSILPMCPSVWTGYDTVNNQNVALFNRAIAEMTVKLGVHYVNIAEQFANDAGELPADVTSDGVHLTMPAYQQWAEYLKTHTAQ